MTRSRASSFSTMSRSNRGSSAIFSPARIARFIATIPNEWKNGSTQRIASCPSTTSENSDRPWIAFATRFACESIAPFESPVVPPV